jgi:beta-galactosidase
MKAVATRHDGSRPVSIAPTGAIGTGGLAVCDVVGYNYADPQAEAYHKAHPDRPVIGTETVSAVGTRGIYITDPDKGFVSAYDPYTTTGRASAEGWWRFCDEREWLAGGFVWTGFDYRGEPSPNAWPNISSQYGIIDTCGFPKDSFFYYQSWWTAQPVLHLFPHWNWPGYEGKVIAVWVHSNMDKVELFLNGQSLGIKELKKDQHLAWNVKYVSGVIEARGYKDGKLALTARRETSGPPAALVVTPDRKQIAADGEDVAMFTVEVRDAQGRLVPVTSNNVTFKISGSGRLIGVGNGDPTDHDSDKGSSRKAFGGLCMAIVQSTKSAGSISVEATSPGLSSASVTIDAQEVKLRQQVAPWERIAPKGSGATGLWRPEQDGASQIFILQQDGDTLTGTAEGVSGDWAGGVDAAAPILDGKVDGSSVSFKVGNATYVGTMKGDHIELVRAPVPGPQRPTAEGKTAELRPAIGPAPDGSDPSRSPFSRPPGPVPVVLHRVQR